jgi:hypothetical protein
MFYVSYQFVTYLLTPPYVPDVIAAFSSEAGPQDKLW